MEVKARFKNVHETALKAAARADNYACRIYDFYDRSSDARKALIGGTFSLSSALVTELATLHRPNWSSIYVFSVAAMPGMIVTGFVTLRYGFKAVKSKISNIIAARKTPQIIGQQVLEAEEAA